MNKYKHYNIIPGRSITLGCSLAYLGLIVFIPLSILVLKTTEMGWQEFISIIINPRVLAAYKITFSSSLIAALCNVFFGFIVCWFLVRIPFVGKQFIDALIDLPFVLPTAVSGIILTVLYSKTGWIGSILLKYNIKVAFTQLGIIVAMIFISFPFVIRTLQPVLSQLDKELEEISYSLGANKWKTFYKVIFPAIYPAMIMGFTLSFARSLGEYGAVIFIAGNIPMHTEITSLLIVMKLDQYNYNGAAAIAIGMLVSSFLLLFVINVFQSWISRGKYGR